jgi:HlyD family secretion protein
VTEKGGPSPTQIQAIIVGVVIAAVSGLSIWYLVRPQPLLVQGEVDGTRFDLAARVDGRVGDIPVVRGHDVPANAVLVHVDNPETIAKHRDALAAKAVADTQLANINAGTCPEVIAAGPLLIIGYLAHRAASRLLPVSRLGPHAEWYRAWVSEFQPGQ